MNRSRYEPVFGVQTPAQIGRGDTFLYNMVMGRWYKHCTNDEQVFLFFQTKIREIKKRDRKIIEKPFFFGGMYQILRTPIQVCIIVCFSNFRNCKDIDLAYYLFGQGLGGGQGNFGGLFERDQFFHRVSGNIKFGETL